MKNGFYGIALALYSVGAPLALAAQSQPAATIFNVLSIFRETVKPGKVTEHDTHEEAWSRASSAAKNPVPMLAAGAMSGAPEIWYMSVYPTWSDFEKTLDSNPEVDAVDKRFSMKEGEYLTDARRMIFRARRDLGYGPDADLAKMRYFSVMRVSVRPGQVAGYEENRKMIKAAHETARLPDSFSIWESVSGAPTGTFLVFVSRKSLAEIDSGDVLHGPSYLAVLGGDAAQKKMAANSASAVISSEQNVLRFLPQQSLPPAEWVTADPKFWGRKPPKKVP